MAYLLNDQNFEKYFVLLTLPNLVYFCINHNNGNKRLIHSEWLKSGYMYLLLRIRSKISLKQNDRKIMRLVPEWMCVLAATFLCTAVL